jgi:hypothetical protein
VSTAKDERFFETAKKDMRNSHMCVLWKYSYKGAIFDSDGIEQEVAVKGKNLFVIDCWEKNQ